MFMLKGIYDGYTISDTGEVYDQDGNVMRAFNNCGYACVYIGKGSHRKRQYIHKMVAEAFLENPQNFHDVIHLDGNRLNNSVSNLAWCDKSEIMRAAYHKDDYILDITTGETYSSYREAADAIDGSRHGVYFTAIGIQKHHKGHTFKFI